MNCSYQPTPMEISYAYYLIRTVFPNSFRPNNVATTTTTPTSTSVTATITTTDNNNNNNNNNIHISGKYMVPFLSKSNLSRPLLRDIWSLIDPNALGYVATIQPQFITILRYIAIVQQHSLLPNHEDKKENPYDINTTSQQKEWLQQCLIESCHRTDIGLAQFDGYIIPSSPELMMYLPVLPPQSSSSSLLQLPVTSINSSCSNHSTSTTTIPNTTTTTTVVDTYDSNPTQRTTTTSTIHTASSMMSMMMMNPTLTTTTTTTAAAAAAAAVVVADPFATFIHAPTSNSTPVVELESSVVSESETVMRYPQQQQQQPQQQPPQQQHIPSTTVTTGTTTISNTPDTTTDVWGAFDALTVVVDAPLPALSLPPIISTTTTTNSTTTLLSESTPPFHTHNATTMIENKSDDIVAEDHDFGDIRDTSTMTDINTIQLHPSVVISNESTAVTTTINNHDEEDFSDGFGEFVAPPPTAPAPASLTEWTTTDNNTSVPSSNGWDALDALVDETNHHIPSMSTIPLSVHHPSATSDTTTMCSSNRTAMIDFPNNITTTPITTTTTKVSSSSSSIHEISNHEFPVNVVGLGGIPTLSTTTMTGNPPNNNSTLMDDPLVTTHMIVEDDSDGFGDFVSPIEKNSSRNSNAFTIPETNENGWDAFDALVVASSTVATNSISMPVIFKATTNGAEQQGDIHLDHHFTTTGIQEEPSDMIDSAVVTKSQHVDANELVPTHVPQNENGWDALDALVSTVDIPVPPLPVLDHPTATTTTTTAVLEDTESEGFGDFVSPDTATSTQLSDPVDTTEIVTNDGVQHNNGISISTSTDPLPNMESGWDALDALTSTTIIENAPMSSLQSDNVIVDESTKVKDVDNEGFSDFVSPSHDESNYESLLSDNLNSNPLSTARALDITSPTTEHVSENGWDAFDALTATTDVPMHSLPPQMNEIEKLKDITESESEGFGDFVGTTTEVSTNDAIHGFDSTSGKSNELVTTNSIETPLTAVATIVDTKYTSKDRNDAMTFDLNGVANDSNDKNRLSNGGNSQEDATTENLPQDSAWTDGKEIDAEFGKFVSEGVDTKTLKLTAPSISSLFHQESSSDVIVADPFDVLNPSDQATLSRPIVMYDRADSTYYSAQAKSVSSDSDYNNFEDATMNESEFDTVNAETNEVEVTNINETAPNCSSSNVIDDSIDPFTVLSNRSTVEPTTKEWNFANETDGVNEENEDDFDAFTDFQGITEEEKNEIVPAAANFFTDHNDIPIPHHEPTNFTGDVETEDFGDFEAGSNAIASTDSQNPYKLEAATVDDAEFGNFDDFSAFEASAPAASLAHPNIHEASSVCLDIKAGLVVKCDAEWILIRDEIISKSKNLPKNIRQANYGMIDFGACFDDNIQRKLPLSESRIHQIIRSAILMDRLSTSRGEELSHYWVALLHVIKNELLNGVSILQVATTFCAGDWSFVIESLKIYVCGLKEFVRVSRCIIATVADLFMLDVFTMLSSETIMSLFKSNDLAVAAYEIEQLWEKIHSYDERLSLGATDGTSNRLEDIVEIRSRLFDNAIDSALCDFTLLPLPNPIKRASTQNVVTWSEKTYIVCAANLVSNTTDYFNKQSRQVQI